MGTSSHSSGGDDLMNLQQSFFGLSLSKPASLALSKQNCELPATAHYRGHYIKPLASYGTFVIEPSVRNLAWIRDHTSGDVHPDMPTIAMLYHQHDFGLPESARDFLSQSSELAEEAEWEKKKAIFYAQFPENDKSRVFEKLRGMSALKASRIIAKRTSLMVGEVLFRPLDPGTCSRKDADLLNNSITNFLEDITDYIPSQLRQLSEIKDRLQTFNSYQNQTLAAGQDQLPSWNTEINKLHDITRECGTTRLLHFQLNMSDARFDTHTRWIHIGTGVWHPGVSEYLSLPDHLFEVYDPKFLVMGNRAEDYAAIQEQMELFVRALQKYRDGHFLNFESYHNDHSFTEFVYRIDYMNVSPHECSHHLKTFLGSPDEQDYFIASKPVISELPRRYHEIKVYINLSKVKIPTKKSSLYDQSLKLVEPYTFCLKCFAEDHTQSACSGLSPGFP